MKAPPINTPVQERNATVTRHWQEFFTSVFNAIQAQQASGTTLQRPNKGLFVGRTYFDTTLGYRIEYNGTQWVRWDGVAV